MSEYPTSLSLDLSHMDPDVSLEVEEGWQQPRHSGFDRHRSAGGGRGGGGNMGNAGPEWWGQEVGIGRARAGDTAGCKQSGAQGLRAGGAVSQKERWEAMGNRSVSF